MLFSPRKNKQPTRGEGGLELCERVAMLTGTLCEWRDAFGLLELYVAGAIRPTPRASLAVARSVSRRSLRSLAFRLAGARGYKARPSRALALCCFDHRTLKRSVEGSLRSSARRWRTEYEKSVASTTAL